MCPLNIYAGFYVTYFSTTIVSRVLIIKDVKKCTNCIKLQSQLVKGKSIKIQGSGFYGSRPVKFDMKMLTKWMRYLGKSGQFGWLIRR